MSTTRLYRILAIIFAVLTLAATGVDFLGLQDPEFGGFVMKDSALRPLYESIGMKGVLACKLALAVILIITAIMIGRKSRRQQA